MNAILQSVDLTLVFDLVKTAGVLIVYLTLMRLAIKKAQAVLRRVK